MLNYFIDHQQIVLAWMIGGFCGTMLSIFIDTHILDLYAAQNETPPTVGNALIRSSTISLLAGLITAIFVAIDYWLNFHLWRSSLKSLAKIVWLVGLFGL